MSARKRRVSRRDFLSLAGAVGAGLGLNACTPPATPSPTAAPEGEAAGGVSQEALTLNMMTYLDPADPGNKVYMDYVESEWKKLYPNGTLSHETVGWGEIDTKTAAYVAAGTPLDVGANWSGATPTWVVQGIVEPLDDRMPQWWWDERLPAMINPPSQALYEDKLYLASTTLELPGMIYRKDLLEAAGIDPLQVNTFADHLAAAEAVATKTELSKPYALFFQNAAGAMDTTDPFFRGNGLDNAADFKDDASEENAWIEAATFLQQLFEFVPEDALGWYYDTAQQGWMTGVIGFMHHGNWLYSYKDQDTAGVMNGDKTIARPYVYGPSLPTQQPYWAFNATGFFLMKGAANAQAAADWIAFATSTEACYLASPTNIPPTKDWSLDDWRERTSDPSAEWWMAQWLDIISNYPVRITPGFLARDEISQHLYEGLIRLWRKQVTPADLYTDMREFSVPLLEEAREQAGA